jgi:hypothetical protein
MSQLAARLRVTLFLSCPEQDRKSRKFYNSLFVIAANGTIVGTHRKINTLRVGSEACSTPGNAGCRHTSPSVHTCRDADLCGCIYVGDRSKPTGPRGQLLVSAAAWAPGHHGPNGEWERCTHDTGLPLIVCNRTGPDARFSSSRECRGQRRAAASVFVFRTVGSVCD